MQSRFFSASLDRLHDMLAWIRESAAAANFDSANLYKIELASEEALVNVIRHSYGGQGGDIEIAVSAENERVEITITDTGARFNPLAKRHKSNALPLEERELGGLGLLFIRKCLDEASYHRKNNKNVLTLIKKNKK